MQVLCNLRNDTDAALMASNFTEMLGNEGRNRFREVTTKPFYRIGVMNLGWMTVICCIGIILGLRCEVVK